ncbi:MAG: hypothetical protein IT168_21630 [Bryobacterales bacterium]|nr:hypothetical protein [Bryobacterales bacterium]
MAYIVDSTKFQAEGAYMRWNLIAQRLGIGIAGTAAPKFPETLQLRWTLKDELGFPSEPFLVWRRHKSLRAPKEINAEISTLGIFGNAHLVDLKGAYTVVDITLTSVTAGVVMAFAGAPLVSSIVTLAPLAAGNNVVVRVAAPSIEGLLVSVNCTINAIAGIKTDDLSASAGWEKLESVGIPVKKSDWAGIGNHGVDQGIFGAFTNAQAAAVNRLERGAPPFGWSPKLDATTPAPPWTAPGFGPLITELNQTVLADLRQIAGLPAAQHAAARIDKPMPPPENSSGQAMSEPGSTSKVSPLSMLYMGAGADCFACLALGFGTAYPVVFINTGAASFSALDYDYMITAHYEKSAAQPSPIDYAAIVPTPSAAVPPPVPANLLEDFMGHIRPLAPDGNWRGSVRVSWDKPVPIPLFRARSYAFARAGIAPASPAVLVMNQRASGGPLPIAVNYFTNAQDQEPNRLSGVDRELAIPSNPGTRSSKYAVAHQDIFGQWSVWSTINSTVQQPPVDKVRIVSAEFKFTSVPTPPNAKCPANLVIEFLWDWRIRSPQTIGFRGRLHAASYHGEPPPDTTLPTAFQTRLAGPFTNTFTLNFNVLAANGAPTSSWPGYNPLQHCQALNPEGDSQVAFGNAQGNEGRRYRVTIPGFELDFASTGHIGLALWAQAREAIAPARFGPWSPEPSVIATSDPRPPVITPDIVTLSSLPDAAGESHAVLSWSGTPGAEGYFIYESTETKLLKAVGDPEPDPDKTLSLRLTRLLQIFDANPNARRTEFTRRNSRLIKAASADVTLPRGSTAIHVFVVLGVSAGQVEAAWPTSSAALYAFAVPRVPKPGTPMIEVAPFLDKNVNPNVYRAKVRVTTRKGPIVSRIELHRVRVDDAAKELDTMGPPVLAIDEMTAGWTPKNEPEPHIVAEVQETPSGSWKRVWYRAAAWSQPDPLRGTLTARSPASTAAWVVIPPSTPPNLSQLTLDWPGGDPEDVLVKWTSTATLKKTPLGTHKLSISAKRVGAPPGETPLIAFEGDINTLGLTQPVTGSGAWRIDGAKPQQYRAMVRRANLNDAVQLTLRITDPLGRTSEALATIKSGHILPDPVLGDFQLKPSVAPPGSSLEWKSTTPVDIGPYTLRVTVNRPPRRLFPNGPLIPQPPVVLEMALADVPLDEPGPVPAGLDPLRIRRMPGAGPNFSYYAFVRVPFTQINVRLTSPDGRVAQHTQLPS